MNAYNWLGKTHVLQLPKKIIFGMDAAKRVGLEAKELGGRRALIVTDEAIEKSGLLEKVRISLKNEGFELKVVTVRPEPTIEAAEDLVKLARKSTWNLVVGVGGGSHMDMAKIASIMTTNPGDVAQYVGVNLIQRPGLRKILVPTTAGTGSEVTANAILASTTEGIKMGVITPHNLADAVIVDPLMTVTMPQKLTATTGLDALSHAIEGYMSLDSNPLTDALALEAIRLVSSNLPVAVAHGENLEARCNMSLAALIAGMVISGAGTCAGHAAAYAFATKHNVSHGLSCAIALPYIMEYNAVACLTKYAALAQVLGERVSSLTLREAASKAVASIIRLMTQVDLPLELKDLNVTEDAIPRLAQDMLKSTRLLMHNPRKVTIEDATRIFERMWEGKTDGLPP